MLIRSYPCISVLAFCLPALLACGPASTSTPAQTEGSSRRPIAEYEATRALLMSTGWGESLIAEKDKLGLSAGEIETIVRGNKEFENLIASLVESQGNLQIYLYAYQEEAAVSEYELWRPRVEAWNHGGASIDLFEVNPKDFPGTSIDDLREDRWTRDFGSFTVMDDGKLIEIARDRRGQYVNRTVAQKLDRPIEINKYFYEGGAIMTTSDSICAHTDELSSFKVVTESLPTSTDSLFFTKFGCKKLLKMPPLPNEETTHIDLFAKFINDRSVLLASYVNDDIQIERIGKEFMNACDDKAVTDKNWDDCERSPQSKELSISSKNLLITREEDLKRLADEDLQGVPFAYKHGKLREHLEQSKTLFEEQGFEVTRISNPTPSAEFFIDVYHDKNGQIVHRSADLAFTHRSYTNSLISNGHLYLPTYQEFPALNQSAHEVYEKMGLIVHNVDMSVTIKSGGAVHCLTKDLH